MASVLVVEIDGEKVATMIATPLTMLGPQYSADRSSDHERPAEYCGP